MSSPGWPTFSAGAGDCERLPIGKIRRVAAGRHLADDLRIVIMRDAIRRRGPRCRRSPADGALADARNRRMELAR